MNINKDKNEITLKDILKNGMITPIVIDKSFLVIDGNRRLTIIRRILKKTNLSVQQRNKLRKIDCIIIPEILTKSKIFDYETKLQMGEDPKLDYNPINRYLKINKLLKEKEKENLKDDVKYELIANLMGTKYKKRHIKEHEEIFKIMKDYLNFIGEESNYMQLNDREDQFKFFLNFWKNFENNKLNNNNFTFENKEICSDIKKICYALINQQVEGKKFREIFPKARKVIGPLTSRKSLEYLKKQLKIDEAKDRNLKKWASKKDLKFPKDFLKLIIDKSKEIAFSANKEENQLNKIFVEKVFEKVSELGDKLKDSKDKSHNKKFLKLIEKIKYKINEIINDIQKGR